MATEETDKLQQNEATIPVSVSSDRRSALSYSQRLSYGVGHVLNDLTASMWFSYLLIFLHKVNNFENLLAGNLMLIGQVSDALFTPFVGYESDHTYGFCNLGKRKSWHLVGTLCVLAIFSFIFMRCINCANTPDDYQLIYYAPMVVIFQFGWASVQISHLSFSSDFTPYKEERVTLQSIRNLFTVFANLTLFGVFALLFYLGDTDSLGNNSQLGPDDAPKFRNLAFICLGIGIIFNTIFYVGTREKRKTNDAENGQETDYGETISTLASVSCTHTKMLWKDWLKEIQFYQIAVLYMSTRLFINITQVYFPMYLVETIKLSKIYIALMPLFVYCSSFLTSILSPFLNRYAGRKPTYFIGLLLAGASCVWMAFIQEKSHQVYGSAVLLGAAGSVLLITSLSMASDLIAANTESGAFVFGAMSFTDKLSNGIAVLLIQKFHPCGAEACCSACDGYYRLVTSIIPGAAVGLAFIAFLTLLPQNIGVRKIDSNNVNKQEEQRIQCSCGQFYVAPGSCVHCVTDGEVKVIDLRGDDDTIDERSPLITNNVINGDHAGRTS